MHIPDSAISPATSLAAGTAMLPVWYAAGRHLRASLSTKQVPLLAIGAAFCFTIMMFNIPVPGGTTVHPIGGTLLAVLLGPWAAVIGVTVALVIQALFFADGGVLAAGANCFAMAFGMPFSGYFVYRLTAGNAPADSPRRALAAGIGAYVGLNVAALLVAVFLGIQPALHHEPGGRALYFPFDLRVTLPAIMLAHLTIAGAAEAVVTAMTIRYLQAARIPLYGSEDAETHSGGGRREMLWVGLGVLAALSPLGLLARGDAWGEWGAEDLAKRAGYLPKRLGAVEEQGWKGFDLLPDYLSDRGPVFYILAAAAGILLVSLLLTAVGRLLARPAPTDAALPPSGSSDRKSGEIPAWLIAPAEEERAQVSKEKRRRGDFGEKTLKELAESARDTLFAEKWARQGGLLQRLDPRVKIVAFVGFVLLTAFFHRAPAIVGLYLLTLALAALSRLPLKMLFKRVWLSVPLFVGAATLPAALNVVTPGPALLILSREPYLAITTSGLAAAGLLTLRVGVAVSFVVLLSLTTRWNDLLRGLRVLFVPRLFLVVLAMTYRYLAVLAQAAAEMFTARQSRTVGRTNLPENRRFLGGAIGALFGRTLALTDEVHAAMLSRGWTGEAIPLRPLRLRLEDALWLGAMGLCAAVSIWLERMGG